MQTPSSISWHEASRTSEERLRAFQHIAESLRNGDPKERNFAEHNYRFLESLSNSINQFVALEEENIRKVKQEIDKYRPEQLKNDSVANDMKGGMTEVERQMQLVHERLRSALLKRKDIADQIDPTELSKIKFKDFQDDSNNIFKWCLQAIYKESIANYEWSNFKKQAFVKDKGEDFLNRLKGLNLLKFKKEDFMFGKNVLERKVEYLNDLEPKGKHNVSLRHFLDYMDVVVQVGQAQEDYEVYRQALEEKQKEYEKKSGDFNKASSMVKTLEQNIAASTFYIDALSKLKPLIAQQISASQQVTGGDGSFSAKNPDARFESNQCSMF